MNKTLLAGGIALTLSILDILFHLTVILFQFGHSLGYIPFYMQFQPFHVRIPFIAHYVDLLLLGVMFIASIRLLRQDKNIRIIAFFGMIIFAQNTYHVISELLQLAFNLNRQLANLQTLIIPTLMAAGGYIMISAFYERWNKSIPTEKMVATKAERFWAYLIDTFIYVFMLFPWMSSAYRITPAQRIASVLILIAYFIVFERLFLFTPGKLILNTRVQTEDGETPGEKHIFIRNLARLIPFEALSFFDKRGLHDKLAKTQVFKYKD